MLLQNILPYKSCVIVPTFKKEFTCRSSLSSLDAASAYTPWLTWDRDTSAPKGDSWRAPPQERRREPARQSQRTRNSEEPVDKWYAQSYINKFNKCDLPWWYWGERRWCRGRSCRISAAWGPPSIPPVWVRCRGSRRAWAERTRPSAASFS